MELHSVSLYYVIVNNLQWTICEVELIGGMRAVNPL